MQLFRDSKGGAWEIDLSIGTVMRVRAANEKYDLFDPLQDDLSSRLDNDLAAFWELLWLLVEPQARGRSVDAAAFGESMAAECLIEAQGKFLAEWIDFFHCLQRPDKATALEKMKSYNAKAMELVKEKIKGVEFAKIDGRVEAKMRADLDAKFGELREFLDSTLGPSPSDTSG